MDPRLDRFPRFHPRMLDFPMATLTEGLTPQTKMWKVPVTLDQGTDGACVGFAWTQYAAADPDSYMPLEYADAYALYKRAQQLDETVGENYSGSSTLGGAEASKEIGRISSYHWAQSIEDIILAVSNVGSVVIGINWYNEMFNPDGTNTIHVNGYVAGGHDTLLSGYDHENARFRLHNSWGADYGDNGEVWISVSDMNRLFAENGDACLALKVPVKAPEPVPEPLPGPGPTPTPPPAPEPAPASGASFQVRLSSAEADHVVSTAHRTKRTPEEQIATIVKQRYHL